LKTNYDALLGELTASRNLTYIFIASTIVLAAATIFVVFRKPRITPRAK